jgi:hypothetical protein
MESHKAIVDDSLDFMGNVSEEKYIILTSEKHFEPSSKAYHRIEVNFKYYEKMTGKTGVV